MRTFGCLARERTAIHALFTRRPYKFKLVEGFTTGRSGLELLPPGVVQLNQWRPDPGDKDPGIEISIWAGLGRKN